MASDKTCEKLITREVLSFPASKLDALDLILDALDSNLDTRSFRVSRIESRSSSFKGLSTYICTVLYIKVSNLTSGWIQYHARRETGERLGIVGL